ncbi:uncharacterized protein E0L32_010721 [Thyridium curvatum]|uniref:Uncharacterized protein n=1 Tax=Thyridium curvatum TaxID=1093900 RepID=A0A507AFY8_9PEZI|nr:uncharacterized protein E0L32_010721 [Thyridium curvatum]TPX07622.1 hypothetical protein E0L32_010721 [Thyridium curvatum]
MERYTFDGAPEEIIANVTAILASQAASKAPLLKLATTTLFYKLDISAHNTTLAVSDSAEWCPREVTHWNLLFWMIGLATNALSQPTGRILGLWYPHHAILRASPILYAADAITVIVRWVGGVASFRGVRGSASYILASRFVDERGLPHLDAIGSAKRHAWIRLWSFLSGVTPLFIKFWTNRRHLPALALACGTMFVVPWAVFELLVLAADPAEMARLRRDASKVLDKRQEQVEDDKANGRDPSFTPHQLRAGLLVSYFPQTKALRLGRAWATVAIAAHCAPTPWLYDRLFFGRRHLSDGWMILIRAEVVLLQILLSLLYFSPILVDQSMYSATLSGSVSRHFHLEPIQRIIMNSRSYLPSMASMGPVTFSVGLFVMMDLLDPGDLYIGLTFGCSFGTILASVFIKWLWNKDLAPYIHIGFTLLLLILSHESQGSSQPIWLDYLG